MRNSKTLTEIASIKQQLALTYRNHLNPIYNSISLKQVDNIDEHIKVLIFGENGIAQCLVNKLMNIHPSKTYNNGLFNFFVTNERLLTLNYGSGIQFFQSFAQKISKFVQPALIEVTTYNAGFVQEDENDQNQYYSQISYILDAKPIEDEQNSPFMYILAPQINDFTSHESLELLYNLINVVDKIIVVLPANYDIPQHIRDFLYICQQRELLDNTILCQQHYQLHVNDVKDYIFNIQNISQQIYSFCNKIMKIYPLTFIYEHMDVLRSASTMEDLQDAELKNIVQIDSYQNIVNQLNQYAQNQIQQDIQYFLNDVQVVQKELNEFKQNNQVIIYHTREKINIYLGVTWIILLAISYITINIFAGEELIHQLENYHVLDERIIMVTIGLTAINIITQIIKINGRPRINKYEELYDSFRKNITVKSETLQEVVCAGRLTFAE